MESKYSQILIKNGILDPISKVDVTIPDLVGEHFFSIIEFVRVQFKNEARPDTHLFVKKLMSIADPEQRSMFEDIMENEGFYLTTLLEQMRKLCFGRTGANGVSIDGLFPKVFHANKEAIVMENLTKNGYHMLDKSERQNFDQAKLVVESLARFQAVSHALILQEGGRTAFLTKNFKLVDQLCIPEKEALLGPMFTPPFDMLMGMLKTSTLAGSQEVYAKLSKYTGKWFSAIAGVVRSGTFEPGSILPVMNHGDCWNNNMMFKEVRAKEQKVVFFDLQNGRVGSPCLDIGYFLFISPQREVRKQWKTLLKIYFDKFQEISKELGVDITATFEDFLAEFRVLSKFGLLFAVFLAVGMEAMKTQDSFLGNNMTEVLDAWISNNADKVNATVQHVIDLFNDYEDIGTF